MTIQAIETSYAGCRFRSRLEARWAVFFDRMGIPWEYEPQGFMIGRGNYDEDGQPRTGPDYLDPTDPKRLYLPDFWLPSHRLWVEIKGEENALDYGLILDAVIPHWGLPGSPEGEKISDPSRAGGRMLVLGPLPRPGGRVAHSLVTFHKGDVYRAWAEFTLASDLVIHDRGFCSMDSNWLGCDVPEINKNVDPPLVSYLHLGGMADTVVEKAYAAARSARFEHGVQT